MGRYEDAIEELRDLDVDEDVVKKFEEFKGSTLRQKAESAAALERELADTKAELAALQAGPVREDAFKKFGIDMEGLSPMEKEFLGNVPVPEGGFTDEQLAEIADKYQLPMTAGAEGAAEGDKPAAAEVVRQARTSGNRTSATTLTGAEIKDWAPDKLRRLYDQHPEEYEALLRGETVTGIAFT